MAQIVLKGGIEILDISMKDLHRHIKVFKDYKGSNGSQKVLIGLKRF